MLRATLAVTALRVVVAVLMFIHGAARWSLGIVDDFGVVLNTWGFPSGAALAWAITIGELVGGALLAAGVLVRPIAVWFIVQLLAGVWLIHARAGWFVVGAGRNGMEYSVLLIACLVAIAFAGDETAYGVRRRRFARR